MTEPNAAGVVPLMILRVAFVEAEAHVTVGRGLVPCARILPDRLAVEERDVEASLVEPALPQLRRDWDRSSQVSPLRSVRPHASRLSSSSCAREGFCDGQLVRTTQGSAVFERAGPAESGGGG